MKSLPVTILILFTLASCNSGNKPTSETNKTNSSDTVMTVMDITDNAGLDKSLFDTAGLYLAPIKVLKSTLVKKEYSNYKNISLTYKNVTSKNILGIRFRWYGLTVFDKPADMGSGLLAGYGSGMDDEKLKAGKTVTNQWGITSGDAKKIVLAWPFEVVFEDGTKWALK